MSSNGGNQQMIRFDWREAMIRFIKYLFEGAAVGFAAALVPKNRPDLEEVIIISLVAAATFAVIDLFAPSIGAHARQGAGFAMGASMYNWPGGAGGRYMK